MDMVSSLAGSGYLLDLCWDRKFTKKSFWGGVSRAGGKSFLGFRDQAWPVVGWEGYSYSEKVLAKSIS